MEEEITLVYSLLDVITLFFFLFHKVLGKVYGLRPKSNSLRGSEPLMQSTCVYVCVQYVPVSIPPHLFSEKLGRVLLPCSSLEPYKSNCASSLQGTGEHVQHTWCCFVIHQEICPSISSSSSSSRHLRPKIEASSDLRGLWIKGRGKSKGSSACVPYLSAQRIKNELIIPLLANTLLPRSLHLGPVRTHTPPLLSRVHARRLKLWFNFSFFIEHFLNR